MPFDNKSKKNFQNENKENNQGMSGFQVPNLSPELSEIRKILHMSENFSGFNQEQIHNNPQPVQNARTIDLTEEESIYLLKEISKALGEETVQTREKGKFKENRGLKKAEKNAESLREYNIIDRKVEHVWDEYVCAQFSGQSRYNKQHVVRTFIDYLEEKNISLPTKRTVLDYFELRLNRKLVSSSYLEQALNNIQRFFDFTEKYGIYQNISKSLNCEHIRDLYEEKIGRRWF